jgi:hypothetical protein
MALSRSTAAAPAFSTQPLGHFHPPLVVSTANYVLYDDDQQFREP